MLMTFHASKGLEFPFVALVGLEQGLFPNHRAMEDPAAMEEERHLCYARFTRAKDELHLFHAQVRRLWGGGRTCPAVLFPGGTPGAGGGDSTSPQQWPVPAPPSVPGQTLRSDRPEGKPESHDTVANPTVWRARGRAGT
ncbi:3'-5' exonuclease [Candidatus Synechococcus spongiarum]|uniref:UvrD-like helicase C-terminal domain-containing protein n=1 Tax=Candidatus Synechococcus spongiarum LMB bulk15N TaxID=1943583 RepID=A0A1T1D1R2_9SYNE|nr:hypothetical protein BV53_04950 [Candidatus Synechococcus spongiarum LMB bulk15N]